jgi:hypothetical protein
MLAHVPVLFFSSIPNSSKVSILVFWNPTVFHYSLHLISVFFNSYVLYSFVTNKPFIGCHMGWTFMAWVHRTWLYCCAYIWLWSSRACGTFRIVIVISGNKPGGNQKIRVPAAACMLAMNERNNGRKELDRSSTSLCAAATYSCLGILYKNIGSCYMHADPPLHKHSLINKAISLPIERKRNMLRLIYLQNVTLIRT